MREGVVREMARLLRRLEIQQKYVAGHVGKCREV